MTYCRELMVTTNVDTDVKRFYMKICDVWTRISETDYCNHVETAINSNCYLTRITRKHIRQTAVYYYEI
ncbi:hypothetical protein [Escherichia phage REP7]|uniref:Uncharacterized protein n=1 Tax=Escherichia phage REP5 TaxID=3022458 RepID=A0AAF0AZ55_9CAUD|nr:hypothetical protein [Escherichia phage REP5]WBY53488.1 hypothetical protein [Escherichia phage REP6]WBY53616.1 hypothetical protein [Escherichia phage REP7]